MGKFFRKIFYSLAKIEYIYRLCQRIVYDHNGENNCDIRTNGEYKFLQKCAREMKIFFDVGANEGEWSKTVLDLNPNAVIHAFEPIESTFQKLSKAVAGEVFLNRLGLSSKKETRTFYVHPEDSVFSSLYHRSNSTLCLENREEVEVDTLVNYCFRVGVQEIDFLKVDVEGGEYDVLLGAQEMLKNGKIKVVQFEYGGTYLDSGVSLKHVFDIFQNLNYSLYKIMPDHIKHIDVYSQSLENFTYSNYVAMRIDLINKFQ